MRKSLFCLTALLFSLAFISCSGDDDEETPISNTPASLSDEDIALESQAFSIFRGLCDISDDDCIESLPSDWKSRTFAADIGKRSVDNDSVRLVAVASLEEATDYVAGIVGDSVEAENSSWTFAGIGSLNFQVVNGDDDLFATLDVNISQIPELSQVKFVSSTAFEAQSAENTFKGTPYYHAGDMVRNIKDGTLWMCVRPAGGPQFKDNSYWICLSPYDKKGKCIIKPLVKKSVPMTYELRKTASDQKLDPDVTVKKDWVYATNLMELRTAKAAFHTLGLLAAGSFDTNLTISSVNEELNLNKLAAAIRYYATPENLMINTSYKTEKDAPFFIAYGKPESNSPRSAKVSESVSPNKKRAGYDFIQPVLFGHFKSNGYGHIEELSTVQTIDGKNYKLSVTNTFDDIYQKYTAKYEKSTIFEYMEYCATLGPNINYNNWYYDFTRYLHNAYDTGYTMFEEDQRARPDCKFYSGTQYNGNVIFSPQLKVPDNNVEKTTGKTLRPNYKKFDKEYEDVFVSQLLVNDKNAEFAESDQFDYWKSGELIDRYVDGKKVVWSSENE